MIRVAIADDHAIVRVGMSRLLGDEGDIEVVGEAGNHGEVIQLLRRVECDALLLDISMPGKSGLDTLKQIREQWPRVAVLIVSAHPEEQYGVRAIRAGAAGYLTKMQAAADIVTAVRQVGRGRKYITPELAELLAAGLAGEDTDADPHASLSDREMQTLTLIAAGHALSQIGSDLALSPKTVSVYRARIMAKLGLRSNAELTRYAMEHQLID